MLNYNALLRYYRKLFLGDRQIHFFECLASVPVLIVNLNLFNLNWVLALHFLNRQAQQPDRVRLLEMLLE
jgi:hypothetical protein